MICGSIDVVVQAARLRDGSRRITHITEVVGMEGDIIVTQDIFRFRQLGVDQNGKAVGQFEATGVHPTFSARLESAGLKLASNLFQERVLQRD